MQQSSSHFFLYVLSHSSSPLGFSDLVTPSIPLSTSQSGCSISLFSSHHLLSSFSSTTVKLKYAPCLFFMPFLSNVLHFPVDLTTTSVYPTGILFLMNCHLTIVCILPSNPLPSSPFENKEIQYELLSLLQGQCQRKKGEQERRRDK